MDILCDFAKEVNPFRLDTKFRTFVMFLKVLPFDDISKAEAISVHLLFLFIFQIFFFSLHINLF